MSPTTGNKLNSKFNDLVPYSHRRQLLLGLSCTLIVLLVCTAALLSILLSTSPTPNMSTCSLGHVRIDLNSKQLRVENGDQQKLLIYLGETVGTSFNLNIDPKNKDSLQVTWSDNNTNLYLQSLPSTETGFAFYKVRWHSEYLQSLEDRIQMTGAHWYGGCEVFHQHWPLERQSISYEPYVTNDIFKGQYGGIMERLWFSTQRVAIFVDKKVPLWIEINHANSSCLGLRSQYADSIYANFVPDIQSTPVLEYTIIVSTVNNEPMASFNRRLLNYLYGRPTGIPDREMIKKPIWSTWAKYKKDVNQTRVMDYAKQITNNRFDISQLEIDDAWATHYGDLKFDPTKFPDPKAMTDDLFQMTVFRTTLWTHPFVDIDSETYQNTDNHQYFLKNKDGKPVLSIWWDGIGAVIDATNPKACDWYIDRLKNLLNETGITSYKFDAGETNWLGPSLSYTTGDYPNAFTTKYAEMASRMGGLIETRVATDTHKLPIFTRLLDRNSRWGLDNGLHSMITATLMAATIGYSFVMPDMVGGNAYDSQPDKQLYIRWVQATALLPTVQFSIAPWDYDDEVVKASKSMMDLRASFADWIVRAAETSVTDGTPIVTPIWMVDDSEEAYTNNHQFLVGTIVMVAPVMQPDVTHIDVYLPRWSEGGQWINTLDNQLYNASQTIRQNVTINDLPIYIMGVEPNLPILTDYLRQIIMNAQT